MSKETNGLFWVCVEGEKEDGLGKYKERLGGLW